MIETREASWPQWYILAPQYPHHFDAEIPVSRLHIWPFQRIRGPLFDCWIVALAPNIGELVQVDRSWPVRARYQAVEGLRERGVELPLYASVEDAQRALKVLAKVKK